MRNSKVKGFTLVELIVVIAIIAILAAILVPNMLSYIKQSRYTQADANAKNVHTAATAALAQAYVDGVLGDDEGDSGMADLITTTTPFTAVVNSETIDVPGLDPASFDGTARFAYDTTSLAVTSAAWSKGSGAASFNGTVPSQEQQYAASNIIGYYPTPIKGSSQTGTGTTGNSTPATE